MRRLAALALTLATVACGTSEPPDTLVTSSDPELARMAAELLPDLAERAGLELTRPVRLERRSRVELERYLAYKLDEELPDQEARSIADVYQLLGLIPRGMDLKGVLKEVYLEQVAGFYDPDSTMLFVMDDQPADLTETLLVHELVHAIQDQTTDLDAISDRDLGNDRQAAALAAIEGHATLIMFEFLMERIQRRKVDVTEIPDFARQIRPNLAAAQEQSPAFAAAPRVIQESLLFPYLDGAAFVEALWRARGGRPVPFGDQLPGSTEQVLHPESFVADPRDGPTGVSLEAVRGPEPAYTGGLGEMEVRVLLETHLGPGGVGLSSGWDGDGYALFQGARGPSLVWVSVWDGPEPRNRFVEGLSAALGGFPGTARLGKAEVEGRPAALLEIGGPPAVRILLDGGP